MDLPGLGDSEGDVPPMMLEFINSGGYAPIVSATAQEIVERFRLSGIIIMGLCSGAVSALYAAAAGCKGCRGLVLMNPYFFLAHVKPKVLIELRGWTPDSRLGPLARNIYALIKNAYDRLRHTRLLIQGNRPPKNANFPLLRCWNQLASEGMPILVLKAPQLRAGSMKPRIGEFDYLEYLQALSGRQSRVAVKVIEGANHAFGDRLGRAAVREHTQEWLHGLFPLVGSEEIAAVNGSGRY